MLLDEVAELPLGLQAKLLRAVQDGEIRRVGESQAVHIDVRILCATHQNLQQAVRERRFREDLFYRLKVFTLTVPPLRERADDIVELATMFLDHEGHPGGFHPKAVSALLRYPWPGNVRELQNAVKHGAVLSAGRTVQLEHLPEELLSPALAPLTDPVSTELMTLEEAERRHVLRVLEACHGQQTHAAHILGVGRTTLWRKLKGYGLE